MSTPDTFFYFYLGFTVVMGLMILYLISLFLRWQHLKREEKSLSTPKD